METDMKKIINWGILGAGGIAKRRTLPAMNQVGNARILAIMDKRYDELVQLSKEYNIPYIYEKEEDLLENQEIDAVYVASPVSFHKEQALKVLAAGKHLLLEKPLGLDLDEAEEIIKFSQKTAVKSGAAMAMRFHDGHRKIQTLVQDGKLGRIVSCRAQLTCWFPDMENNWRQIRKMAGGGSLTDMGIHCVDLLRYILQDEVDRVGGFVDTKTFHYEVEDSASILMKMKSGAVCYIDAYNNIPDAAAKCFLEIYGTKGSVIANSTIGQDGGGSIAVTLSDQSEGYQSNQKREDVSYGGPFKFEKVDIYAKQIESFSNCLLNDTSPEISLMDAYNDLKVIDCAYAAAKEGKILPVK